jgi:menaquinol-cytochrome c reductase iron-sulfur subunit
MEEQTMPLYDDLRIPLGQEELARRRFLGAVIGGAVAAAGVGTAVTALAYLEPNVLFELETRFRVGRPEDIAPGQVLFLPQQKIYVARDAAGYHAMSAVCTHLGCMTRWEAAAGAIFCPCHGSRFARDGRVTGGPAPRPLPRFALTLEKGQLVVDTRRPVAGDFVLKV